MIGQVIAVVKVKPELTRTRYIFGDVSMLAGRSLPAIDQAVDGSSYLCIADQNLVDIDGADIESVMAVPKTNVMTSLKEMIANMQY